MSKVTMASMLERVRKIYPDAVKITKTFTARADNGEKDSNWVGVELADGETCVISHRCDVEWPDGVTQWPPLESEWTRADEDSFTGGPQKTVMIKSGGDWLLCKLLGAAYGQCTDGFTSRVRYYVMREERGACWEDLCFIPVAPEKENPIDTDSRYAKDMEKLNEIASRIEQLLGENQRLADHNIRLEGMLDEHREFQDLLYKMLGKRVLTSSLKALAVAVFGLLHEDEKQNMEVAKAVES